MPQPDFTIRLVRDSDELRRLSGILDALPCFALDIETIEWWNQLRERVGLIQIAFRQAGRIRVAVVDALADLDLQLLRSGFEQPSALKIIHNAAFVIIGYWKKQYKEAVVIQITGPGPKANHQLHSFVPDNKYQETEIAKYYQRSGRLHTYMGDWHTHPYGNVSLSNTDRRTLHRIAKYKDARLPIPLMAILGGASNSILKVWCYEPSRLGNFGIRIKTKELKIKIY